MATEFMLRYRGPLPANGGIKNKQEIRLHMHGQLQELVVREPLFEDAGQLRLEAGVREGGRIVLLNSNRRAFRYPLLGYDFVPLINGPYQLACQIDITWLRQERAGDICQGGDLDNRLKCLLDGLRMPLEEKELAGCERGNGNQRIYCLLEDDRLITKLSITTYQLLEPRPLGPALPEGNGRNDVELLIHVNVESTSGEWKAFSGMPSL